jgi:glucosamine--fructose-6-phosphate aminotransferase (isomerizing)
MVETVFEHEVQEQPAALETVLKAYAVPDSPLGGAGLPGPSRPAFIGMGSSLFASRPAQCALAMAGVHSRSEDASELLYYGHQGADQPVLISQSGESPEIKRLLKGPPQDRIAITNDPLSTLARATTTLLPMLAGAEKGTTSKSYTNSVAVALLLAAKYSGKSPAEAAGEMRGLPGAMSRLLENWRRDIAPFADLLGNAAHVDLIGRGPSLATVGQGALILRELAHVKTAALNTGLFRHGMIPSMKRGGVLIAFAPEGRTDKLTIGLAEEVAETGGNVVIVTDRALPAGPRKMVYRLPRPADATEFHMPILEIMFIEFLGIILAERKGMDPGQDLLKVTPKE